ncbi:MAG: DUF58 domain-containing protein [Myxococcota bacterium]|nr:DUF58 domain-containing protein [Myxococcota bacterium]
MDKSTAYSQILEPEALARVHSLRLQVTQTVDGLLAGLHRSPHHGSSVEFAEHKEYVPGDEVRHIDWRIYAKSDKYYVKRFEQETNARAMLLCDASASMLYSSEERRSKYEYAAALAGSLAYILLRQQDAVGLMVADTKTKAWVPPRSRSSHLTHLCEVLVAQSPGSQTSTDISSAVSQLSEVFDRRGLVFVFSDFLDTSREWIQTLRNMQARKQHITLFHVLDPWELTFPFKDMTAFRSLETGRKLLVEPRGMRKAYLREMQRFIDDIRSACLEAGMNYQLMVTSVPLSEALTSILLGQKTTTCPLVKDADGI